MAVVNGDVLAAYNNDPFFAIDLPANAQDFFFFKFKIVAFEMIPIGFMTEDMEVYLE